MTTPGAVVNASDLRFIVGAATLVLLALIFALTYTKLRPIRGQERKAALELGQNAELFFSGRCT